MSPSVDDARLDLAEAFQQTHISNGYEPKSFKVGLDYGTTYSSGTYSLCSSSTLDLDEGDIHPFVSLRGSKTGRTETSSAILYDGEDIFIGDDAEKRWQMQHRIIRQAKIGLDNRDETAEARRVLQHDIELFSNGRVDCVQVIADYLRVLFNGFSDQLQRVGYRTGDKLEINCAVPSIWGSQARRSMVGAIQDAARRSRLDVDPVIKLWPEAEAATEAYLDRRKKLPFERNDVFIVCDAGGGTVDVTTYMVRDPVTHALKELVEASGALCGSTFIDSEFRKYIQGMANRHRSLQASMSRDILARRLAQTVHTFSRNQKRVFSRLENTTLTFEFPGAPESPENGFKEQQMLVERYMKTFPTQRLLEGLRLRHEDYSQKLNSIFDEVADGVWTLLKSQLEQVARQGRGVRFVLFTGGLSYSSLVQQCIEDNLRKESLRLHMAAPSLVVTHTKEYGVALGAIRCSTKTDNDVGTRRISTTSLGVTYTLVYEGKPEDTRFAEYMKKDEKDGKLCIPQMVNWMIKKGQEQLPWDEVNLHQTIPMDTFDTHVVTVNVWACDGFRDEPSPLDYYKELPQKPYIWDTVNFRLKMSIVREKVKLEYPRRRKPRAKKAQMPHRGPLRKSERQAAQRVQHGSDYALPDSAYVSLEAQAVSCGEEFETQLEPSAPEHGTTLPDEKGKRTDGYYKVSYQFRMRFVGLLAEYEFYWKDADYRESGSIHLPDVF